ncbi:hypothetical protein Taro_006155 [Colocasia esculenta]|uniref:pyruvate dehydrogenase (acetyl-transferring) n=1 Tax=Colocasia esculenta TaxID=4460 RepID=A0A843TQ96_COLES|nr:hypothetical protein [Colocasia esculenta]
MTTGEEGSPAKAVGSDKKRGGGSARGSAAPSSSGAQQPRTVGAYALQCANCFKFRLVPTQEEYEEIRHNIIEEPWVCNRKPGLSCDHPADLEPDSTAVWVIDKPNIPKSPPGCERVLAMRRDFSKMDALYVLPNGKKVRCPREVEQFLEANPQYKRQFSVRDFNFAVPKIMRETGIGKPEEGSSSGAGRRHLLKGKKNDRLSTAFLRSNPIEVDWLAGAVGIVNHQDAAFALFPRPSSPDRCPPLLLSSLRRPNSEVMATAAAASMVLKAGSPLPFSSPAAYSAKAAPVAPGSFRFGSIVSTSAAGRSNCTMVVRSDGSLAAGSNLIRPRSGGLVIPHAVAAKADSTASSAASKPGHELLLFEALREGLEEEMDRDPTVCVMGEDVGHYGGSYKVTKGLATKYGDLRVLDTPIAENSFTGMGVGAAMTGLRPIVEGMNMGFLLLAYNQISNNCGMLHYTSGGQFKIPIVIRGPGGVGRQLGAEHSQRLESYFQSIPGLQMVACSTAYNAKGLMKAAIRSDNPVVLFEHVLLYNLKERIPDEEYVLCLEEAEMVRPGEHVTILTYSRMRYHVMQAAKTLVNKGYDPEVIDIRSLKPFDLYTIGNSVKKTHRVLIVEECMRTGGIGASLRAAIMDNFWDYLDAPIMCLSSQDVPTPYAGPLEEWTVVQPAQIVTAVEQLCK